MKVAVSQPLIRVINKCISRKFLETQDWKEAEPNNTQILILCSEAMWLFDTIRMKCYQLKLMLDCAESWAPRIDAFELWCWRRLLRVPWSARRSVLGVHWKDLGWSWNSNTLATWWEELTHLNRPWCLERLRAGGEGDHGRWDGWMAAPTHIWVWVNSGSWW